MPLDLWLSIVAASTVLLLVPGPSALLVLSNALSTGRTVALASPAGVALGDVNAMIASLFGLGALILASATAFAVLRWIGALNLAWLGVRLIRCTPCARQARPTVDAPLRNAFADAAAIMILNPKSIAFLIVFLPHFVRHDAALVPRFAVLIAVFVGLAAMNARVCALVADKLRNIVSRLAVLAWITRAGGATLTGMGVLTAGLRRAT